MTAKANHRLQEGALSARTTPAPPKATKLVPLATESAPATKSAQDSTKS